MGLMLAIKSFFKALKDPVRAKEFISDKHVETKPLEINKQPSHLRLLALLQQSSRLIDFLKDDISAYDDAQVGAAVRQIHKDCGKSLEELVTIRPVMEHVEGQKIHIPRGYDPVKIKVMGNVKGEPPFEGILVHKGWQVHKRSLPIKVGDQVTDVICPAEVEIR